MADQSSNGHHEQDGVSAVFRTRAEADLAVEHLVQEHGLNSSFIYVEPVGVANSAGTETSGGDHASGSPSHPDRADAPLHGAIGVTVLFEHKHLAHVEQVLKECGGLEVGEF